MKILTVAVKGWKDERSGLWHWTPEVVCEYDPIYRELEPQQKDGINIALASEMEAIMSAVNLAERRSASQREEPATNAKRPEIVGNAPAVDTAPAPAEPPVPRKTGDEYDAENKRWKRCVCGNDKINFTSSASGKAYQCCRECNIFLQPDGKVKAMNGGSR